MKCTKRNEQLARRIVGSFIAGLFAAGYVALWWVDPWFMKFMHVLIGGFVFVCAVIGWLVGNVDLCDKDD